MKDKRPPFDMRAAYVARKSFRFHGRTYAPGAEFPWRRLSCSGRKLHQLYDNGFLSLASAGDEEPESQSEQPSQSERRRIAAQKAAATRKRNAAAKAEAEAAAAAEAEAEETDSEGDGGE